MIERTISEKLRENFPRISAGGKLYSFESSLTFSTPDLYVVVPVSRGPALCGWIELKIVPSEDCRIPFRSGQPGWIEDHCKAGGCALVLVYCINSRSFFWLSGKKGRKLKGKSLAEVDSQIVGHLSFETSAKVAWEAVVRSLIQVLASYNTHP